MNDPEKDHDCRNALEGTNLGVLVFYHMQGLACAGRERGRLEIQSINASSSYKRKGGSSDEHARQ